MGELSGSVGGVGPGSVVNRLTNESVALDLSENGSLTIFQDQSGVVDYVPMTVNAVQVLRSADNVPPARACTAFECTDSHNHYKIQYFGMKE